MELAKAVSAAVNLTKEEDTLILVTADHSHVMSLNGYARRGNNILGKFSSFPILFRIKNFHSILICRSGRRRFRRVTLSHPELCKRPWVRQTRRIRNQTELEDGEHGYAALGLQIFRSLTFFFVFAEDNSFKFPSMVPLISETHGGEDVAVFARGPWSHLFTGSYEQNFIPHALG